MKQSTSFAQVATNQFDYLSSALCANTPPCKKHSSSRKFLTLSISLRLLLVMFMTLSVTTNAWGAEEIYKTALFGTSYNSKSISGYTESWSATNDGFTVNLANANNNSNGWDYIKFGRRNNTSVGTITTASAIDKAVTKVVLTIDALTASKINTITLYTKTSSGSYVSAGTFTKATGAQTVTLSNPTPDLFYKIEVDCASGSSNGLITISKVDYYADLTPTATYDVSWVVNDEEVEETKGINEGSKVTGLPADPEIDCSGKTFVGWSDQEVLDGEKPAVLFRDVANSPTITKRTTFYAVFAESGGSSVTTWAKTDISAINDGEEVVVVMNNGKDYALFDDNGTSSAPTATSITISNNLIASASSELIWVIGKSGNELTFYKDNTKKAWLYCTDTNNGVRVGTNTNKTFTIDKSSGYLKHTGTSRYVGIYNSQDWRCYENTTVNIANQTLAFYAKITTDGYQNYTTSCTTPSEYTVTFNANGHGTAPTPQTVASGQKATAPTPAPTATGYTFGGWYKEPECTTAFDFDTPITGDITLYAKWTPITYTVSFDNNGGTGTMGSQTLTYNQAQTLTANTFTRTGYTFSGWNTKSDGSGDSYTNSQSVKNLASTNGATITLYAQWKIQTFTVVFDKNGGTGTMASQIFTYNQAQTLTANTFTRTGYTFSGWNTKSDGSGNSYTDKQSITLTAAGLTLYAQWKANTYTVAFNANGGTGTMSNQSFTYGQSQSLTANAFTRTNYAFKNWNTKADGSGTNYTDKHSVSNLTTTNGETVTLYAQWTPTYTVTWLANGQEFHKQENAVEGTALDLPDSEPDAATYACDDKVFVGWTATPIDGSTDTEPADLFKSKTDKVENAATTYHAVFATVEDGGETAELVKMTADDDFNIGDKIVIIAEGTRYGLYQKTSTSNYIDYWTTEDKDGVPTLAEIEEDSKKYVEVSVGTATGTIKLGDATNGYLYNSSSTDMLISTSNSSDWSIIAWTDDTFTFEAGQYLSCRTDLSSANANKWRGAGASCDCETSTNCSGVIYYNVYKYILGSTASYSDYTTTCDATKAKVTYDLNGGEYESDDCVSQTVTKGQPFNLCSNTPTKEGYTFAGWSDGTKTYTAGSQTTVSESTTFYAAWTAKTITITWNQNYADCPESETSTYIYDGEDIEMPEDPTRSGYQFDGWYTASIDGTKITEVGTTNKPTDDVIYYAHWAELYTVTFMASGQVYVVQEDKYLSGANLELPADPSPANYACDGYIFDGWSVAEKTIEEATKPELITNPTITKDEIYYAVWKKASSTGAGETIFYESFNQYDSPGGNDDNFNTASSDKDNTVSKSDVTGWSGENVYGAKTCIKLGGGSAKGTVTTPALSQLSGSATLSFKAAAWANNNEQTDLVLSITGGGTLDKTSVTMIKGAWKIYEVTIKDGTSATRITFAGKNISGSRFFLDEVKVTTSGGYNYTTSPSCGPTIVAKEGMWVTSSNGQSVKVNVPIAVKSFTTTATITGTSTSSNFVVTPLENVGNGINDVVEVIYTPTTANTKESTTITLTAKDGETEVSTTAFTLNGRSLPDQFAIVVDKASEYYALPANMPSEGTYTGFGVEVNAGTVIAAPKTHLYNARAVHSTRFTENGTALRLVGNNDACLWASTAKDGTSIRNYANISNAKDSQYEWNLYTEDGETYRISCTAVTEEGRILRMYGQKFGMYKSGNDAFRILPVECTSTPLNVSVSAARTSATISWTNADACNVEVYNGSTKVQTISAAASPVVVSNLAESTAYTFTLTPADNESCVASGAFTTTGPTIDIVEWETNGILIQVDKDNELNPKVVIKGEEEHGNVGGNVADELFFSKYFESHGENKLLAIFNGTTATIDLTGYTIKSENGTLDLSQFGQTKGKVASNEEIILVYYDANYSAEECAEEQQGYENWNILTERGVLAFSGRGSLGLYKNDVLIDVIGSTFPSGELTKIGKSDQGCGTGDDVRLHIDGKSVNDQSSFFCFNGDNIKTAEVETNYALSTNRCLLIRKNTVTSGANAVATNKATVDATCGELSSTFATLCSEWSGFRIGSGKSSTDEIQDATCDGLGYVGGFDYNNYYRTLETLDNSKTLNEYTRNADENTYFIEIEDLAQYSCLNIQLQLTDNDGNVLTEQTSQVPILVAGEKYTTDEIFSAIVKDSETSEPDYETSKIRCSTCDVVILKNATLTKADAETVNDVNQVRDIYIYPGGKLVVPANATDYSVNNVSLRRVQDEVAAADIQAPLNITSSSKAPIFVDVRIDANNWHWFALPYDCNIADVTWADGSKAAYNTDWFLMYYDGESRAASTNPHDNHWKVYEGTKIEAGKGYIVGITGDVSKPAVKFELRFPMAQKVLTAEQTDKTVALNAWGVKLDNTPNNKGWNLVGNPYLNYYQPETTGFAGLSLLKYTGINPVTGDRLYDDSGNIPFLVTPIDGGWYEYQQELASDVQMMPFTAYFVQVGDPANPDHTNGKELNASFEASNRGKKSILHRVQSEVDELEDPAIVAVSLTNARGESDKTTLLIADRFTNEYEMNADFFKWFGDYYKYYTKPVLYTIGADQGKRAFNALNEDLATQPISLGMYAAQAGNYTFSLNLRNELAQVQEVWLYDATQDVYTNLLQDDYTFHTAKTESAGRFFLSVKMAPKVSTDIDNITNGSIWATTQDHTIIVNGLLSNAQLWIYDATGKLLHIDQTQYYQHSYSVPISGTYFVRVQNTMQTQTIKVVVE